MFTDLVGAVPAHEHRHLMSFFPTGVSVVTAADRSGSPYGLTCSSLASICLQPPTLLASLTSGSATLKRALERGVFGVVLLHAEARDIAQLFATPGPDRFAGLDWSPSPLGTPWLTAAMTAAADCEVARSVEVGDHTLLFGVVRNVEVCGGTPLMYGLRDYGRWV